MAVETQQILQKLEHIQSDLDYIKEHIADIDIVLTQDDKKALEEARADFKAGKTKSLNHVKKSLGF